jgi:hypothetical protein
MVFLKMPLLISIVTQVLRGWRRSTATLLVGLVIGLSCLFFLRAPLALAGLNDDRFDGNIFALYAGNGSIVPPKTTLADSLKRGKPALLVFYVDDSSDCKNFASVVSQLQAFYGRAASFMPIDVDALPLKSSYTTTEPGYYYQGYVPQTVLLDQSGKVALNAKGRIPFEQVDDAFRRVFDLLPRSESVELKRRPVNEINTELVN